MCFSVREVVASRATQLTPHLVAVVYERTTFPRLVATIPNDVDNHPPWLYIILLHCNTYVAKLCTPPSKSFDPLPTSPKSLSTHEFFLFYSPPRFLENYVPLSYCSIRWILQFLRLYSWIFKDLWHVHSQTKVWFDQNSSNLRYNKNLKKLLMSKLSTTFFYIIIMSKINK